MVSQNNDGTFSAVIDGRNYTFTQHDTNKAFVLFCKLSHIAGEGMHFHSLAGQADEQQAVIKYLLMAGQALMRGIGADANNSLSAVKQLCCDGVLCDGQELHERAFGEHFRGQMGHMMRVVVAALEVQFSNFFDWLAPLLALKRVPSQPASSQ